ncbi:hypothetical protein F4823DRAFT_242132 [Ustulina deusta]|nr:hypothetical protein F4823DRAFT_242132 [Ustulina deusta]
MSACSGRFSVSASRFWRYLSSVFFFSFLLFIFPSSTFLACTAPRLICFRPSEKQLRANLAEMPGIVAATPAKKGRKPSANQRATASSLPIPHLSKSDAHDASKQKQHCPSPSPTPNKPQKNSRLKLAKPFSEKAQRIIAKKTAKLIKRRNALDRQVLTAVENTTPDDSDWLPRDKLLRSRERMERREQRHLRKRTKELAELERLYRRDPSSARAYDYDLARKLLWKFKRNLGPLLDEYANRPYKEKNDTNETSSSGSDADSDSESEWSDASGSEDEELPRETIPAHPSLLHGQKNHRQVKRHSQNTATTEASTSTPTRVQLDGEKRKREDKSPECTSSKKVRLSLREDTHDAKPDQESARKERKAKKDKKKKQASVQEAQINGK